MPYPHVIRLRGPWLFEPLSRFAIAGQVVERGDDLPAAGRVAVPADWGESLGPNFRGRVRYRRSFHRPSTLDPHERLWLIVEGADARGAVSLNGIHLGNIDGYGLWASFDVTAIIDGRNEIALDVELPASSTGANAPLRPGRDALPGGPIGEVRLEVRSQWCIEPLAIWSLPDDAQRRFAVRGRIGGEPTEAPLAVVIGGGERELAFLEAPAGEAFETTFEAPDFPPWTAERPTTWPLEVKLLSGGAAVWQTVRRTSARGVSRDINATRVDQILPETAYLDFDRRGAPIIQYIPSAWAEQVCARLAHHPCIVAWSSDTPSASITYGRQWA